MRRLLLALTFLLGLPAAALAQGTVIGGNGPGIGNLLPGTTNQQLNLPNGTTAQRPVAPATPNLRYNTTIIAPELYMPNRGYSGANSNIWNPLKGQSDGWIDLTQPPYSSPFNGATDVYTNAMTALATGREVYLPHSNSGALLHEVMLPATTSNGLYGDNSPVAAPFGSNFVAMVYGANGNHVKGLRISDVAGNLVRQETITSSYSQGAASIAFSADASFTGSIGGTFSGTSNGTTTLTPAGLVGCVFPGDTLTGTGTGLPTTVSTVNGSGITGACGGTPAIKTAGNTTLASVSVTGASSELGVSAVSSGTVAQNQTILNTGLGTPPMVGETLSQCTSGSSFPCFLPLINAQFTYTVASTTLTVGNAIGILAPGQTVTGGANANSPTGMPAGTTISSQTSGIAAETTGGPGVYVLSQAGAGAGPGIASSQNTVASASLQSTGVQNNMRVHILLSDGTHAPSVIQSVSGLTATLGRPLPGAAASGNEFLASFGSIYLACGATYYDIADINFVGIWAGVYADCPNPANPVNFGYISNINVEAQGHMWGDIIGRNVNGSQHSSIGANMQYPYSISFNGDGTTTSFTIPYKISFNASLSFLIVKVGGTTKTYTTDYTISNDGLHVLFTAAPALGTGNVVVSYHPLAGEALGMDSSGTVGSPLSAGNSWVSVVAGGADNPCSFWGQTTTTSNNFATNFLCGPGGRSTMDWNNTGSFLVSGFTGGFSHAGVIINNSAVTGDIAYSTSPSANLIEGTVGGVGADVDLSSTYSGHMRNPSGHYSQEFENGASIASFGSTIPASTTGTCTVSGAVAAGVMIIPCSSQSGITNGQVAIGTNSLAAMPDYDTIRGGITTGSDPLCAGDCIFLSERTTAALTNGTVLTFTGPVQPSGAIHPFCRLIQQSGVPIVNTGIGTSEVSMTSVALPPEGINDSIRVHTVWTRAAVSTNSTSMLVRLGTSGCTSLGACSTGTAFMNVAQTATADIDHVQETDIYNRAATNSQVGGNDQLNGGFGFSTGATVTGTIQTNATPFINIDSTTTTASSDTVKLEAYKVELCTP